MIAAYGYFDRCVALCREHGLGRVEVANLAMRGVTQFYQNAIEAALADKDWCAAERYAALLEEYTRLEPLPWSDFFIEWARVLAALGAGIRESTMEETLQQLYAEARRANFKAALPALQEALEIIKP
ncbi:hypothetical protein [Nitrosococcus wardiae]|uniref:Tetratricopeptide repeat protein n=1 Tax=Nitrosococcus wardiae TaxID=1814290 RepID=A0A4P7BY09_9GAMM|nr:hypothetical protein [Nitrosococcus wardiae]QBQ55078.1 hypothetical protein E3U44_11570 [Nitrosococcus wardiae]